MLSVFDFVLLFSRSYNVSNLLEDLKFLYRTAGQQGKGITFIFTDQEIKEEGFLEYLNNVLASGVVSNLFARDEMDEISMELIPVMKKEFPRRPPSNENLYEYFMTRTRQNLHVVLCFSPVSFPSSTLSLPMVPRVPNAIQYNYDLYSAISNLKLLCCALKITKEKVCF
jgi:dynein heavy chain